MVQQAPPAVGTVMDGYRFKGGDPKQEASWEQVAPIDVSATYGAGARQLPNGVIERVGPRGGVTRIASANGGASGDGSALVGADARARFMINLGPLQESQRILEGMQQQGYTPNDDWGAAALEAIPFDGGAVARMVGGEDYNRFQQAAKTFEAAILPIMSGAAVTPTEAQRLIRAALPQVGDTPEVLQQKALQRRQMINAVAEGIGKDAPFPSSEGSEVIQPGTRSEAREGRSDADLIAAGYQRDDGGTWRKQYTQDELLALGLRPNADGTWTAGGGGGGPPLPSGPGVQEGIERADQSARERLPFPIRAIADGYRNVEAFAQSFAERIPGVDEAAAWTAAKLSGVPYEQARAVQEDVRQYDRENYGAARNLGGVAGTVAPLAVGAGAPVRVLQGGGRLANGVNAASGGALIGAAMGAGEGNGGMAQRGGNALAGAAVGGVIGPLAQPVANAFGRYVAQPVSSAVRSAARPVVNALGATAPETVRRAVQPNALGNGLNRLADRMGGERVNALSDRVAEQRALGIEPTFIDALDDGSIGRIRALATRDTPARDQAVRFAESRRANLPSRASRIAGEEISSDTRPALQMIEEGKVTRRANADAINNFGGDPVSVTDDVIQALRSDFVRPHIAAAARRAQGAVNPDERAAAARLNNLVETALDNPAGAQLTVREAQDVSRALNEAADAAFRSGSPDGPVLKDLARTVRGAAKDSSDGYANWLRQYGEDSDLIEAATTGRNFVSVSNDPVSARSTEAFIARAGDTPAAGRPIMRGAAREAVEVASSNPGAARTTLDRMASDVDMGRRMEALGVDAGRVQARSRAELDALVRAQRASPRVGSETSTNLQDTADAAGAAIGTVRDIATGNLPGIGGRIIAGIKSRGFSDREAQAIVEAAIDPGRTEEVIGLLAQRMNRRDARSLARAIRYQAGQVSQLSSD